MEGYKIFNPDWTSSHSDIVFEVGKTYRTAGEPSLCETGLHFCEDLLDCLTYYPLDFKNHVCLVRAIGNIAKENHGRSDSKACTNELTILEEVPWPEVLEIIETTHPELHAKISFKSADSNFGINNTGDWNSGTSNEGSHNSGNLNAGDSNAGNGNSGDNNSGDGNEGNGNAGNDNAGSFNAGIRNDGKHNAGSMNAGSRNAGNWNIGNFNVGNHNSGNRNIGDWNAGYGNRGCFCTEEHRSIRMFDGPTGWAMSDWLYSRARKLLDGMTEQYEAEVGCTSIDTADKHYREYAQKWWSALPGADVASILLLPNFNPVKFLKITGIDVFKQIDETGKATTVTGFEECTSPEDAREDAVDTLSALESIAADLENLF